MSYSNDFSNKAYEKASKTAHTNIINDQEVQMFLKKCHIPAYQESADLCNTNSVFLPPLNKNPIKNIITIDGGYTNVFIRKSFPSVTVAFFQFGALFFKARDLVNLKEKPFIDPEDFSKLQNIQRIKLVIPTKGIAIKGEKDLRTSFRKSIYDFFMQQPERLGLIISLKWILFEEYLPNGNDFWHLSSCPNCEIGFDIYRKELNASYSVLCPHCGETVYLTDVFRLHEVIDNELGAGGVLGYLSTTIEQLIIVYLIQQMLDTRPQLLHETLFIKDGPLAFFGQTANIHKPMRKLIAFLNRKHCIYLVGLEKSGAFVEHAAQISLKMKQGQIIPLGNRYIYKYIIPGNVEEITPYASSTYYSHKLIFNSTYDNVYVATIPSLLALPNPIIDDYINYVIILHNITALKCDLYYSSLVPVVMANKLVSLADHPSSDLLKSFAQDNVMYK